MTTKKELLILNKLECLSEIRFRMEEMDRVRVSINEELDLMKVEEQCLQEYRREMDSLYQEKMTHVEELRQIHSDVNMLENVLKKSEEDRARHLDNVKRFHQQLQHLKMGVEKMRAKIGMPKLNENNDHDEDLLPLGITNSTGNTPFYPQDTTVSDSVSSVAAFRQQAPPMKFCTSCHQQIHRNAPICPLCKAKSRRPQPKHRNKRKNLTG